jgi:hypothetical protein
MNQKQMKEFMKALNAIAEEKKIDKSIVVEAMEQAMAAAYKKNEGLTNVMAKVDDVTGDIRIYSYKTVVETVENPDLEISLEDASKEVEGIELGDTIKDKELPLKDFGRVAAQTAKQIVVQRVKEAEKQSISGEFQDKDGELMVGTLSREDQKNYFVDLGRASGILPKDQISLMPNDIVVFSSSPIPGNTASVSRTINKLYKKGVKVFTNTMSEIHSSGHANQEELKLMIRLFKPKYFVPYHGEFRMLKKHTDLGVMCGIPRRNTFVLENGDVLALDKGQLYKDGKVQAGEVYVDGSRIGDVGSAVIKDRILMSTNGILVIIANIDIEHKILLGSPAITTRGYILVNENTDLIKEIQHNAEIIINKELKKKFFNFNDMKSEIINGLMPILSDKTGRVPIILPIVMGIKTHTKEDDNNSKKDVQSKKVINKKEIPNKNK